jgi:hypothetical protein
MFKNYGLIKIQLVPDKNPARNGYVSRAAVIFFTRDYFKDELVDGFEENIYCCHYSSYLYTIGKKILERPIFTLTVISMSPDEIFGVQFIYFRHRVCMKGSAGPFTIPFKNNDNHVKSQNSTLS